MEFSAGVLSRRGGALFKLLVFLAIFAGVLIAAWIFALPPLLTSALTKRTGFEVKVQHLALNPFSSEVELTGLVVENPHTYPRRDYIKIRDFQARAHFKSLFSDLPDFDFVRVDVEQIVFVRNTDGTVNATLFYDRLFPAEKAAAEREEAEKAARKSGVRPSPKPAETVELPGPPPKSAVLIRRLELKLDHVTVADYYGRTPSTREFNMQVNQVFQDVKDAKQLFTPQMIRAVGPAALAISALIPGEMGRVLSNAAGTVSPREGAKKSSDSLKSIVDTLEESRKP